MGPRDGSPALAGAVCEAGMIAYLAIGISVLSIAVTAFGFWLERRRYR